MVENTESNPIRFSYLARDQEGAKRQIRVTLLEGYKQRYSEVTAQNGVIEETPINNLLSFGNKTAIEIYNFGKRVQQARDNKKAK